MARDSVWWRRRKREKAAAVCEDRVADVRVKGEGLRLAYLYRSGQGRPIVFLHGMGSSRLAFLPLMERLPIKVPAFALDLPGFGASSLPRKRQALLDYVYAVHAFLWTLGIRRPILVGHSFGGMVAAETAIRYPDDVAGVLLAASAGFAPPRHVFQPTPWVWVNRIGIWITGLNCLGTRMAQFLGLDPARMTPRDRWRLRYGWRRAREMARMGSFYETERMAERLAASEVPAIAIAGDNDPLFPLDAVKHAIGDYFPLWVMVGVGHLPFDSDLYGFMDCLKAAYRRLTAPA